jgi:maltose alpha-D-glucosyltransferase/alpha-amylase
MMDTSNWYKNAIFYEVPVRAFYDSSGDGHGDLRGLAEKLDYLKELGIDCLWLLPLYPSPLKDDGYDVADFYGVMDTFGTINDFRYLVEQVHQRGMYLIADLVLNHTSDQHPWFQAARQNRDSPFRDYYVWSDTDRKFEDARIIFLDTEKSNWTYDEVAGQYYWHRFYSSQPDLNFDNPAVQKELINVLDFWLKLGIDGFRVDAVPYLYEREGTNCENLPETHRYLQRLRKFVDKNYPDAILLCEANQWPEDVRSYFGNGDEFHLGFHFPLMPRIFMSLKSGNPSTIIDIMQKTPDIPDTCQWCTFLRNHDELTLEMVTEQERGWMWEQYAPEDRMRLNLGIRRRLAPLLDADESRIFLGYGILFGLPGSPVIYYGDEIGMGDDIRLPDRDGVRTPMQWTAETNAGFSTAVPDKLYLPVIDDKVFGFKHVNAEIARQDPDSLMNKLQELISVRKQTPELATGELIWEADENPGFLIFRRKEKNSYILAIYNLELETRPFMVKLDPGIHSYDLLYSTPDIPEIHLVPGMSSSRLTGKLSGSGFFWLRLLE